MPKHHKKVKNNEKKKKVYTQKTNQNKPINKQEDLPLPASQIMKIQTESQDQEIAVTLQKPKMSQIIKKTKVHYHVIKNSEIIEEEQLGIRDEAKKIKKIFLQACPQIDRFSIKLRKSNYYPSIFIQYRLIEGKINDYLLLRDLVKHKIQIFKGQPELLYCLYENVYEKVPYKYQKLVNYGIARAKQLNIPINNKSVYYQSKYNGQLMFYYCISCNKSDLNFTLIDKNLKCIEFSNDYIYKHANQYEQEENLYHAMKDELKEAMKNNVLFNDEQLEEQQYNGYAYIELSFEELKQKLNNLLCKSQEQYKNRIQSNKNHLKAINKQLSEGQQIDFCAKLEEQTENLQFILSKYNSIINQIKNILKKNTKISKKQYQLFIRRIHIAEKQLDSKLPIIFKKEEIFKMLNKQSIVILQGQTGSGKSTQLPQLLCQYFKLFQQNNRQRILVTQPRKIATRTIAQRVSEQIDGQKNGGFVDYSTSIAKIVNPQAKIIFKLDRLLVDEITEDELLSKYSCLIIDEAHERTISIDILVGLIKNIIKKRPEFKVIITSASMDVELFQQYFDNIRSLKVSGRLFNVQIIYKTYNEQNSLQKIKKVLNQQIIEEKSYFKDPFSGHALVFCHSIQEINLLLQYYKSQLDLNNFQLYPLHGKLTSQEQKKVFKKTKKHKIIFTSRIAETAITIDDIRIVVDPGEDYENVYDQQYKYTSMKLKQISQSSAKQRAGRAGRTSQGYCFRLYDKQSYQKRPLGKIPQISNSSLDTLILRLKSLGISNVIEFPFISPPSKAGLKASNQILKIISALDQEQNITPIGEILLKIPIQPMLARSLLESILIKKVLQNQHFTLNNMKFFDQQQIKKMKQMDLLEEIIQIVSMLVNSSNLFNLSQEYKNESNLNKFINFPLIKGDFFYLKSLYSQYKQLSQMFGQRSQLKFWFNYFFINKKVFKKVKELQYQIKKIINSFLDLDFDILQDELDEVKSKLRYCKNYDDIVLLALASSFIPNLCRYSGNPEIGYTLISEKKPIKIYGSSTLSLLGLTQKSPQWILSYQLYTSQKGIFYCKLAQQISIDFLQKIVNRYAWNKFQLAKAKISNPFYQKIYENMLPTKIFNVVKNQFYSNQFNKRGIMQFLKHSAWVFNNQCNKLSIYMLKSVMQDSEEELVNNYHKYISNMVCDFQYKPYMHSYFGNTKVFFNNKFEITKIEEFTEKDIMIQCENPQQYLEIKKYLLDQQVNPNNIFPNQLRKTIKISIDEEANQKNFMNKFYKHIKQLQNSDQISIRQYPKNNRKILQSKVLLIIKTQNPCFKSTKYEVGYHYRLLLQAMQKNNKQRTKTALDWKQKVSLLLMRIKENPEECAINIWRPKVQNKYKGMQIHIEINSLMSGICLKLKELQYIEDYLGCKVIAIRENFEKFIAFPQEKIFNALKQDYVNILSNLYIKFQHLSIVDRHYRHKNNCKIKIFAKSWDRVALDQSYQQLSTLFEPKYILLQDHQMDLLQYVDYRQEISKKIQIDLQYNIFVCIEKNANKLIVYCSTDKLKEIQLKFKEYVHKSEYMTKQISYKNKSLSDIMEVINARKSFIANNTIKDTKIQFQINFSQKSIFITTIREEHTTLASQIDKITNKYKQQCTICSHKIIAPYKLINCSHQICSNCFIYYVKSFIHSQQSQMVCPNSDCNQRINIFDIQYALGQSQFQKICDEKTVKFVKNQLSQTYTICAKCEAICNNNNQSQTLRCNFCSYSKCLICSKQNISNLHLKQCPKIKISQK